MVFINSEWQSVLQNNQLIDFESIWNLSLDKLDEGNFGRGGFSIVSRYELPLPNGIKKTIYIKRQENYLCFNWRKPWKRRPTLAREFENTQKLQQLNLGTFEVLYFATREKNNKQQAILISAAIPGIDLLEWNKIQNQYDLNQKIKVIKTIAQAIGKMHDAKLKHGHLAPFHVFLNIQADNPWPEKLQAYFIDLELMRRSFWGKHYREFDLAMLCRRSPRFSYTQYMRFLKYYLNIPRLSPEAKKMWRRISKRIEKRLNKKR